MVGGSSLAVVAKQKREIRKQIAADQRSKARVVLASLRAKIRAAKASRIQELRDAVVFCRAERTRTKDRAKELRQRALAELREARLQEKIAARHTCTARKQDVRTKGLSQTEQARHELKVERAYQAELRGVETRHKQRAKISRRGHAEQRQESDDAVRSNLPADLLALFERVKRGIRGSDRQSRTEAFLHYAEEHPSEVLAEQMRLAEQEIKKLMREEHRLAKAVRRPRPPTDAELAAIPF